MKNDSNEQIVQRLVDAVVTDDDIEPIREEILRRLNEGLVAVIERDGRGYEF